MKTVFQIRGWSRVSDSTKKAFACGLSDLSGGLHDSLLERINWNAGKVGLPRVPCVGKQPFFSEQVFSASLCMQNK